MRQLALHHFAKARVWLDEVPDAFYPRARMIDRILKANPIGTLPRPRAAVELFVPLGPHFMYALLGCEFELLPGTGLHLEVAVSTRKGVRLDNPLSQVAEAQVGLPEEYTSSVIEYIADLQMAYGFFPAGRITFACAAHSPVGSSRLVFSRAAEVVAKLITLRQPNPSDEELIGLFPSAFSKTSNRSSSDRAEKS